MQQWPLTRLTDVALHDWDMFITPAELAGVLERHGLAPGEMTGLGARAGPSRCFGASSAPGGGASLTGNSAGDLTWDR